MQIGKNFMWRRKKRHISGSIVIISSGLFNLLVDTDNRNFIVPGIEIPWWLNCKHKSVGNSISFRVGRKFPNFFAVYFAFGLVLLLSLCPFIEVYLSINGFDKVGINRIRLRDVSDTLRIFSRSHLKLQKLLNESNPSDYNHIEVTYEWDLECSFELRRWGVNVECICCPKKSSISSSMALPLVDNDSDSDLNLRLKKRRKYWTNSGDIYMPRFVSFSCSVAFTLNYINFIEGKYILIKRDCGN